MKVHEYQAKEILSRYGVKTQAARRVTSSGEAAAAYRELGGGLCVVKAQVHAGGRGKGGGVKLVDSAKEAGEVAEQMLSRPLVTPQTGPEGVPVRELLVAKGVGIEREMYVGITIDRSAELPVLMASTESEKEQTELARAAGVSDFINKPFGPEQLAAAVAALLGEGA